MNARVRHNGLFIDGKEIEALSQSTFAVHSPADGQIVGYAALADHRDVERAVIAATNAFPRWNALTPAEREHCFLRAADLLEQASERFLPWIIDEGGSTITKATFEWKYSINLFRTAAGEVRRLYGDTFPADRNDRLSLVIREPMGVIAAISPFNAPLALLVKMIAFPLAAGNTVIAKPSEETPMIALELANLLQQAGFPDGVFNVVTGLGSEAGEALVSDPRVHGITFTGSTAVGRKIAATAGERLARVHLELGGKNPVIVLRDADPKEAARIIATGAFAHAGQICMSSSRIIAEKEIARELATCLAQEVEHFHLGDLRDERTVYGPVINERSSKTIQSHISTAVAAGAELVTGGEILHGLLWKPTVLFNPPKDSLAWSEETFGPVTCIHEVDDLEEAIQLANDSEYGLSAGILSNDLRRSISAARRIRCGSVHIGAHSFQSDALAPIGGYGVSSIGRSGGKYSVEHFTELKWITLNLEQQL